MKRSDAQEKNKLEETMTRYNDPTKDPLTGLMNRETFLHEAEKLILAQKNGYYVISCIDIDCFRLINDQYGIEKGDMVLKHVGKCIEESAATLDGIACRFAADRFGILYPASRMSSNSLSEKHLEAMSPGCIDRSIKVRIGRYIVNNLSLSVSDMYDRATLAQKSIKDSYEEYVADFAESMQEDFLWEQTVVSSMKEALENGEFEIWLQPQYNHATGDIIGAEALVRWRRNGKLISPDRFIPIFERNGFIYKMDQYIWEGVCRILRRWIDEGRDPLTIAVNISRRDIYHADFITTFVNIVEKYSIPYDLISLEVTESAFAEDTGVIVRKANELIDRGFAVEIDDFGCGYSSLNTLKDVPASILKLDMKFFENTKNQQRGGNIVESVVRMAKWIGMAVIAEGVEEKSQADFLKSIGCNYIQGYYYAKPMPVSEYEVLFQKTNKEHILSRIKTLEEFDNSEFWNPKSMETLIFNSYVGGACIFEVNDNRTEILRANDQYRKELGKLLSADVDLKESGVSHFLDETNRQKAISCMEMAVETKKELTCELTLTDGKQIEYIRMTMRLIARADKRYLFYCVVVNETERHKAQEEVAEAQRKELESAKQLEVIMKSINGGVSAIKINDDGSSKFVFSNERYFDLYGYSKEEVLEKKIDVMSLIVPEDKKELMAKVEKLKKDGIPAIIDYRITKKNGTRALLRANASLMSVEGYGDDVITSVITDITEINKNYIQFKFLTNNIPGGIATFICKKDTICLDYYNDGVCELAGVTREEFEKRKIDPFDYIFEEDRPILAQQIRELIKSGKPIDCIIRMRTSGDKNKWINCKGSLGDDSKEGIVINTVLLDVTEHEEERERLRISEEINRLAIEHSGNIITKFDVKNQTLQLPKSFNKIFDIPHLLKNVPEEQIQLGRISPDTADVYRSIYNNIVKGQATGSAIYQQNSTKGWRWLEAQFTTIFDNGGEPVSAVITFTDISEKLEKEVIYNKWQQSIDERTEGSYTFARCNLSKGATFDSWEGDLIDRDFMSKEMSFDERTTEYAEQWVYTADYEKFISFLECNTMLAEYYRGHRNDCMNYRQVSQTGEIKWIHVTVDLVEYPNSKDIEAYIMFEDIDDQKKEEMLTIERAERDALTYVYNRAAFIEKVEGILSKSRAKEKHALLMLDIDNFKEVNDTLGHGAGDQVLKDLTSGISSILRKSDLIGRMGGDEFFVFLKNVPDEEVVTHKAEKICNLGIIVDNTDRIVTTSIGIAMAPKDGKTFDELYKKVDHALYERKRQGKNGFMFVKE